MRSYVKYLLAIFMTVSTLGNVAWLVQQQVMKQSTDSVAMSENRLPVVAPKPVPTFTPTSTVTPAPTSTPTPADTPTPTATHVVVQSVAYKGRPPRIPVLVEAAPVNTPVPVATPQQHRCDRLHSQQRREDCWWRVNNGITPPATPTPLPTSTPVPTLTPTPTMTLMPIPTSTPTPQYRQCDVRNVSWLDNQGGRKQEYPRVLVVGFKENGESGYSDVAYTELDVVVKREATRFNQDTRKFYDHYLVAVIQEDGSYKIHWMDGEFC